MPVLAVVDDLLFRSKLEAGAAPAGIAMVFAVDAEAATRHVITGSCQAVVIDLGLTGQDALDVVRRVREIAPALPVFGFCAHVDVERQQRAHEAGCTMVLPHSAFLRQWPALLGAI